MKHKLSFILISLLAITGCASGPQRVIFDTDLGNDTDDILAFDMLHKYQDQGKVSLLAVMTNKDSEAAPMLADVIDTWYGRPEIPIGKVKDGVMGGGYPDYASAVCDETICDGKPMFKRSQDPSAMPDAAELYRKILAAQPNHSVTIISTGFSTNLAHLLASGPDQYSKLSGKALVKKKVKSISVMGGDFADEGGKEFNIVCDIPAAQKLFAECPVKISASPFELGREILYPASSILEDFDWGVNHPMVECYIHYLQMPYDRMTWDLTAVLYAIEPQYFTVSEPGTISVDDSGVTTFVPSADGLHTVLSTNAEQNARILSRFKELITALPSSVPDPSLTLKSISYSDLIETSPKDSVDAWYDCSSRIDPEDVAERGEQIRAQKKLIVFDLDATLCAHKHPVPDYNIAVLDSLGKLYSLAMCGGGNTARIYHQMGDYPIDIVGNYGMETSRMINDKFAIVQQLLIPADTAMFQEKCMNLRQEHGYTEYAGDPLEFHASGMVTFGLLGTAADPEKKLVFDPDRAKRRAFYKEVCDMFPDFAVFIGGSTSFDFVPKRFNKYDSTMKYAMLRGFTKDQVLYVGDDFGDGGGDSQIRLGGMDYIHITDYTKLPEVLSFLYE